MLEVMREYGVEDPCKAQYGIDDHDNIVYPAVLQGENISKASVPTLRLE